jgi:transcriptional regulator with XRE-family HTH domain
VTLAQYLKSEALDHRQFAERIGVSPETARRYLVGERIPDKKRMARIVLATGGNVTANDFYGMAA